MLQKGLLLCFIWTLFVCFEAKYTRGVLTSDKVSKYLQKKFFTTKLSNFLRIGYIWIGFVLFHKRVNFDMKCDIPQ